MWLERFQPNIVVPCLVVPLQYIEAVDNGIVIALEP
jgi:hypothetical protein